MNNVKEKTYSFDLQNTCSKKVSFDLSLIKDSVVLDNVKFEGGCQGNLKAISALLEFIDTGYVFELFKGDSITCKARNTSCINEFLICLKEAVGDFNDQ